jgi:hypothetical protein
MNFFAKLLKKIFGEKITVTKLDSDNFLFDSLTKKEAKPFFYTQKGLLIPQWDEIETRFKSSPLKSRPYLRSLFSMSWCKHWSSISSNKMKVYTSPNLVLISYDDDKRNELLLKFAEKAYQEIHSFTGGMLTKQEARRHLVIHVTSEDYYLFEDINHTGWLEPVSTGGKFCPGVVPYMIFHSNEGSDLPDIVLAHELCHSLMSIKKLPLWLDEALACTIEKKITGVSSYDWSLKTGLENVDFWDWETIQFFWTGESFSMEESQKFSYLLAQGLMNCIIKNHGKQFFVFAKHASKYDAGNAAAKKYLGCDLSQIASEYLGSDDWRPNQDRMEDYFGL